MTEQENFTDLMEERITKVDSEQVCLKVKANYLAF